MRASVGAILALLSCVALATALVVPRKEMESGLWGTEAHNNARSQWRAVSRADPNQIIKLTFAVKQTNKDELEATVLAVSDPASDEYGQHLTRDEVDLMVAPRPYVHAMPTPTPHCSASHPLLTERAFII
jgi:tripeptidyl-peptidase-1